MHDCTLLLFEQKAGSTAHPLTLAPLRAPSQRGLGRSPLFWGSVLSRFVAGWILPTWRRRAGNARLSGNPEPLRDRGAPEITPQI
jgi:hypothetical protein